MRYEIRPISDRTVFKGGSKDSPFTAGWQDTLNLLDRELTILKAADVVFEIDVLDGQIRLDGMLRNDARAATPAVRLIFESKHGLLSYATDVYHRPTYGKGNRVQSWQHNMRAIALALEALRKVERYGIGGHGEQYAGWLQIEAGPGAAASHMTCQDAAELLERLAIGEDGSTRAKMIDRLLNSTDEVRATLRHARAAVHPDRRDGDRTLWDQVEQAARVLGVLS